MSALNARPARSTAQRDGSNDVGVRSDGEGELQVVDRGGQAEQRDAAVEQQRDALQLVVLVGDAEADLLDVERAEAALDREPPRAAAVAGAQRRRGSARRRASAPRAPG